jgi:hypothetical protein
MKYYVIESALSGKTDFLRLGKRVKNSNVYSEFETYMIEGLLVNDNVHGSWYDKYKEINTKEKNIQEFNDDKTAMLWFKLNHY